ncbi:TPA: endonuclease III [bacterium]|jgi:endonuclease-3|nr:endonuclease III [bacterium]
MKKQNLNQFLEILDKMFPHAHGELNYQNIYQLFVAVMLSAQTTDVRVNIVTPSLFEKYPSFKALKEAKLEELEDLIKSVGLYKTKAKNLISSASIVVDKYNGEVPTSLEELIKLPGVGRKTASVILIEGHNIPAFPVDTHIERTSKRLGFALPKDDAYKVELKLRKKFPQEMWRKLHHQMIFLGRYVCLARKPDCENCLLNEICPKKEYKVKSKSKKV